MSEPDFIFMLTRDDRTVADAAVHLQTALAAGVGHIGFKDIGLPFAELAALNRTIRDNGARSYLEVVSLDVDSEIVSVRAAVKLGVDYLLGGTHVAEVLPLIEGTDIRYYPFAGGITGHPSVLEGSIADIAASAIDLASHDGVHGLDLLAYRSQTDVPALIKTVCASVNKPVIVAGSIDRAARIQAVIDSDAAGFTVGTAALDGVFPASRQGLAQQLLEIRAAMAKAS